MMHPWYGERCPPVPTAPTPSTLQLQRGKQVQSDTTVLPAAAWDGACSRKHTQPQHSKPGEQQPTPPVREKQAIESKRHRESYRKVNKRLRWKKKKKSPDVQKSPGNCISWTGHCVEEKQTMTGPGQPTD